MNQKQLTAQFGLKWNPFLQNIPTQGMYIDKKLEKFCWRVENLVMDGGFAMVTGGVGTGKSTALRFLATRLAKIEEIKLAELARPQSNIADFYRELADLFEMSIQVTNRFNSYKILREKWKSHIESTYFRPVLLVDEAQEMLPTVLSELRLMSASSFDSKSIITVILCGDERLPDKFRRPELVPVGSRIRVRHNTDHLQKDSLTSVLKELITKAGNPSLMTEDLVQTIAERSMGNYRAMVQMANSILIEGARQQASQLDEKLFFDLFDFETIPRRNKK